MNRKNCRVIITRSVALLFEEKTISVVVVVANENGRKRRENRKQGRKIVNVIGQAENPPGRTYSEVMLALASRRNTSRKTASLPGSARTGSEIALHSMTGPRFEVRHWHGEQKNCDCGGCVNAAVEGCASSGKMLLVDVDVVDVVVAVAVVIERSSDCSTALTRHTDEVEKRR